MDVAAQNIQLGGLTLTLPYTFVGIGRSNNYIENFQVIISDYAKDIENYNLFTPIIPNSQLIISKNIAKDSTDGSTTKMYLLF